MLKPVVWRGRKAQGQGREAEPRQRYGETPESSAAPSETGGVLGSVTPLLWLRAIPGADERPGS
jgi:hypothetical protein